MAIPSWAWTAGQIINTVAVECGLSEFSDPYASTDANALRLRTLLKIVGRELIALRDWQELVHEHTITGDGNSTFDLPADFLRMVDESGWNRTSTLPLSLQSSQGWQALRASASVAAARVYYRVNQHQIQFYEAPPTGNDIRFDYVSRYWAAASGAQDAELYEPAVSTDKVVLDPMAVSRLLKVKFLAATGQETAGAQAEYLDAVEAAAGNGPAPTLSLSGSKPYFPTFNVRDRGYGS